MGAGSTRDIHRAGRPEYCSRAGAGGHAGPEHRHGAAGGQTGRRAVVWFADTVRCFSKDGIENVEEEDEEDREPPPSYETVTQKNNFFQQDQQQQQSRESFETEAGSETIDKNRKSCKISLIRLVRESSCFIIKE